jgi:hypothetical protein
MCPSWKMMAFVNGKDDIPYMKWKIKKNVWNQQPGKILFCPVRGKHVGRSCTLPRKDHIHCRLDASKISNPQTDKLLQCFLVPRVWAYVCMYIYNIQIIIWMLHIMCVHNTNYTSIAIQPDQDTDPNLWLQWTCIFFIDCSHVVNSQFIQAYPKPKLLNLSRRITYFAKPWLKIGRFRMAVATNHPSP